MPSFPPTQKNSPRVKIEFTDQYGARYTLTVEGATREFKFGTFSSKDILQALREEMGLDLSLPTVSAYLTRLFQRRILSRTRNGSSWLYRLLRDNPDDSSPTTDLPPSFTPAPDIITT